MQSLYKVTCCGRLSRQKREVYVVAESFDHAANKALTKVREMKYDRIDDYVASVVTLADEKDTTDELLIL